MKRIFAFALSLAISLALLAGCGGGNSSSTAPASTPNAPASSEVSGEGGGTGITTDDVTLRFMWWGGDERNEATMQVIAQFEALYPNVTIEAEYGGNEGYKDKLVTQLYGGNAADIVQTDPAWLNDILENGDYFVNLDDYTEYFNTAAFDESMLNNFGMWEGKTVAVPTGGGGIALVYSKDLVEQIGLDISIAENDWDGLIELGKQVQEYDAGMYLLNIDTLLVAQRFLRHRLTQMSGEPIVIDDKNVMSFTRDQLIEVLEYIQALYESGTFQPASASAPYYQAQSTNPAWIEGRFVGDFNYASAIMNDLNATGLETEWIVSDLPMPADRLNDAAYSAPNQMISITASCEYPEVAALFLEYFYNNETAIRTLGDVRGVPTIQAARDILEADGIVDPIVAEATEIAAAHNGKKEHGVSTGTEVTNILVDMVERVAYSNDSIEAIADDGIQQIQYVLDDRA